jgi:chromosome segregation ATPase
MTLGSSLNLSPLASQNISFVQVAAFGGLTKAIALLSSYITQDIAYQKTVRLFSHIAGGAFAYGVTRFLPVRTWISNFPEPLSWEVAAATTFTIYLFSSSSLSKKSLKEHPQAAKPKSDNSGNPVEETKTSDQQPKATLDKDQFLEGVKLLGQLKADEKKLEDKLKEVDEQLTRLEKLSKSFGDKSALKDQLAKEASTFKQLQADIDASKAQGEKLKALEEEQKAQQTEITKLQKDLESAKKRAVELMAEKSKATSQTAVEYLSSSSTGDLEKKLREAEQKNQSLQSEAEALWAQLQASKHQLEQQVEQHLKSLAEKSAAMEDQEKNYQQLQEKHSSTLKQLKNSEDAYAEMQARWNASEERMKSQLSLIQSSTQKQLKSSEDAYAEMQARWNASEERMKSQLSLMQKGLEEFEQKVTQLNEELAQERQKRAQAEAALQDQGRKDDLAKTQPQEKPAASGV